MQTVLRPEPVICPGTAILPAPDGGEKQKKSPLSNGPWSYPAGRSPSAGRRRTGATVGAVRNHADGDAAA